MTTISIIVPTLNEEKYIGILLNSLQKQTRQPTEIIIVDGFSQDKTRQIIKMYPSVKLLKAHPPVGNQRNQGARVAKGDTLIFLDADTTIPINFINQIHQFLKKQPIYVASPMFIPQTKNPLILLTYLFFNCMFWLFQKVLPSGASTCLIIHKKTFLSSGGFSSEYKFEDIELIRRLSKKNAFKILPMTVYTSPRRFYKQGVLTTIFQYLLLSVFFCTNQFKIANKVPYFFGNYSKN